MNGEDYRFVSVLFLNNFLLPPYSAKNSAFSEKILPVSYTDGGGGGTQKGPGFSKKLPMSPTLEKGFTTDLACLLP